MAYMNVAEIETAAEALAGAYPTACQRIELPHQFIQGRAPRVSGSGPPPMLRPGSVGSGPSTPYAPGG